MIDPYDRRAVVTVLRQGAEQLTNLGGSLPLSNDLTDLANHLEQED